MTDFAARARAALDAQGLSLGAAARELHFDVAYLSRVLNGKQTPSAQLAEGLDSLVGAGGCWRRWRRHPLPAEAIWASRPGSLMTSRTCARRLTRWSPMTTATAVTTSCPWRSESGSPHNAGWTVARFRRGANGTTWRRSPRSPGGCCSMLADRMSAAPPRWKRTCWRATLVTVRSMERFALTNLAMMGVEVGSPGESLRIADELLSQPRVPPRVALLARIRRGRALASTGDHRRALDELGAARAALEDSVTPRDPAWTWWVNECELAGHEGEARLALGDAAAAVPKLERAAELAAAFQPDGRGVLYYRVSRVEAYTAAQAWRECEEELTALPPMLGMVSSGRNRRRLRVALRELNRHPDAPVWLTDLAHDVADVMRRQAAQLSRGRSFAAHIGRTSG